MSTNPASEHLEQARQARQILTQQFQNSEEVSLIDIGADPENPGDPEKIVVRVHLRSGASQATLGVPVEVQGIPVRVIVADYRLE
jgi:hypothetical protein